MKFKIPKEAKQDLKNIDFSKIDTPIVFSDEDTQKMKRESMNDLLNDKSIQELLRRLRKV